MTTPPADELGIVTGEAVALDVRATSFVLRGAGAIIDWLAEFALFLLLLLGIIGLASWLGLDEDAPRALSIAAFVVAFIIAPTLLETALHGRSLGKLAVGARVVRDDGGAIGARHAFVRALVGVVEITMTLGGLAALVGLLNRRAKRLGDYLAGTVSQHERVPRPRDAMFGVPVELEPWSQIADVARLPDPVARRVATFLAHAPKLQPTSRARLADSLAAEVRPFIAPLPAVSSESLLAGVAVLRREREAQRLALEEQRVALLQPQLTATPNGFAEHAAARATVR